MFDVARLAAVARPSAAVPSGADGELSRSLRRKRGAYFTPMALVELVVEHTLEPLLDRLTHGQVPPLRVVDPACGDGRFLAAAAAFLVRRLGLDDSAAAELRRSVLIGIERDARFAELAERAVPGATIHRAEALLGDHPVERADAVIGNPPYLRSIHLGHADDELRSALRRRYAATSAGEWDLYAAFLEWAYERVAGEGEVGFVVPSRWTTAQYAAGLRAKLGAARALRGFIDFGAAQVFEGATTYASVVLLSGIPSSVCAVARLRDGEWTHGSIDTSSLGAQPWRLAVGSDAERLRGLGERKQKLGDLARIVKGAGTNCDPVYVFESVAPEGGEGHDRGESPTVGSGVGDPVEGASSRGEGLPMGSSEGKGERRGSGDAATVVVRSRALNCEVEIERRALRSCLRGRDVRGPNEPARPSRILVPYHLDGTLWSPEYLRRELPLAWQYLERCRDRLDAREGGRFAGARFYRFGRPQNMRVLLSDCPRVIVPDVSRGGRATVDRRGTFVLDSAYAVVPHDPELCDALAALLASDDALWWLQQTGVLLRGGYVRMKTAFLRDLPVTLAGAGPGS